MGRKATKVLTSEKAKAIGSGKRIASPEGRQPAAGSAMFTTSHRATMLAAALIALATIVAYSNSLGGPFMFDDDSSILENTTIRSLWPIGPVLSPPANGEAVQRRPVVNLSLAVNYAISGYEVWSYHALNLFAHLLAAFCCSASCGERCCCLACASDGARRLRRWPSQWHFCGRSIRY